ncbi:hypothetical protein THMIRHAS_21020 [Thiosulfatimonas sediminis]|uniref:Uncharacterized protein n=1 Tax=Thiosulfatimonas sediminis TaxID=2675054 RepID=A0A6F8PX81_9GAMM|nr:hypothetical protein THMIRHAS_21020 [Thiosulfatimonas sediminis]
MAIILIIVVIAIIAVLWLSSKQGSIIGTFKNKAIEANFIELNQAKDRLLQFAALTPELYHGENLTATVKPPIGIGYFPCPDGVGGTTPDGLADWNNCSTGDASLLLSGYLPRVTANTNASETMAFAAQKKYLYYVDKRYVLPSLDFTDDAATAIDEDGLFAPLTVSKLEAEADGEAGLTLNGSGGFIAFIVDPGSDNALNELTISGSNFFYSIPNSSITSEDPTIDKLVAINYQQHWLPLMARRTCREKSKFVMDYADYQDNDGDGSVDPVYGPSTDTIDQWKLSQNWFYWGGADTSWYQWGVGVCR